MAAMERQFEVGVPIQVAHDQWELFQREAGGGIEARFEPGRGEDTRVRLRVDTQVLERARLDQVAEAFQHFVTRPGGAA
jgi:hypothetical protein